VSYSSIFSRIIAILGISIYASVLYLTFSVPGWLEEVASSYIEQKLSERIDTSIDSFAPPQREGILGDLARKVFESNEEKIAETKERLRLKAHESLAGALAQMCRSIYADKLKRGFEFKISMLQSANDKIVQTIQSGYMGVVAELKRDIRIFSISNIGVFCLLLLASFLKPTARVHLLVPAVLLTISTLVCSYFYVFEQNWILTIIHSDYVGFGYLAYLAIVASFLADIVFNKARITTKLLNGLFNAIGSAISVAPC